MPDIVVGDNKNLAIEATVNGKPYQISSATVSVWDTGDTKDVNAASMTPSGTKATYQVATSVNDAAGTYKVTYYVVFANSQGTLSLKDTYTVVADNP